MNHLRVSDFYIKKDSLILDGENCFLKNQKFDGINTICAFALSEFQEYLNDFGKELFITKGNLEKYRHNSLPTLFEGTIGNMKVLLIIKPPNFAKRVYGKYVYLKYGQGIALEGKIEGDTIELKERHLSKTTGYFKGKIQGNTSIKGTWTTPDKTTNLKFNLVKK